MTKVYVLPTSDGWLNVRLEPSGQVIAIPEYLAVDLDSTRQDGAGKRDYFTILEGVNRSRKASVRWSGGKSNLSASAFSYRGSANLVLDKRLRKLSYPGGSAQVADLGESLGAVPIANGTHPVQIPDFPHPGGRDYLSRSPYATSWFYLGIGAAVSGNNDRYLHTGRYSAGCITMDASDWTALYKAIIFCRRGNNVDVGTVVVR
jgi:hypothetical protein